MASPFGPRRRKNSESDADLSATIEAILRDDSEVARLTKRIARAQRRLRKLCSPAAWQAYLDVEAETNTRYEYVSRVLLRYGLTIAGRYMEPKP